MKKNFYFTFGTNKNYPYSGGWVTVEAFSYAEAVEIFRSYYPDRTEGIVNCASIYSEAGFRENNFAEESNPGNYCHKFIDKMKNAVSIRIRSDKTNKVAFQIFDLNGEIYAVVKKGYHIDGLDEDHVFVDNGFGPYSNDGHKVKDQRILENLK